jgi:hypothetical protein
VAAAIFLIRHAEKPDPKAGIGGVSHNGQPDGESLSVRGWQRAGALSALFGADSAVRTTLARPATLCAAVDAGRSGRPYDTLRPLAERLALPIRDMASSGDMRTAAAKLWALPRPVLVCWRHRELPILARALLPRDAHRVPARWDEARFDLIWVIEPENLVVVPQSLLAGDASEIRADR